MRELVLLVCPMCEDLISRQRNRGDVFAFAGILGDLVVSEVGLVEHPPSPWLAGGNAGRENKSRALEQSHCAKPDICFTRAARQNDHAAAAADITAGVKNLGCLLLIIPNVKSVGV